MNSRNDFLYPEFLLQIGSYSFTDSVSLDWYSSKKRLFDYIEIRFTEKMHQLLPFSEMEKVTFSWGYTGNLKKIFSGYVERTLQSGNELIAKDAFFKLQQTKLKEIFLDVSQKDYLSAVLRQAGVSSFLLENTSPFVRKKVNINDLSFTEAIAKANEIWRTQELFYFDAEEKFYFGAPKKQSEMYEFQYGESILNLSKNEGMYEMEVIASYVDYTNQISVKHPSCNGTFEVDEVRFHITTKGFPKMYLYFKEA